MNTAPHYPIATEESLEASHAPALWRSWSAAVALLTVGLVVLVTTYWPTALALFRSWAKDPLGHGYFVLPGAIYLAWDRREALRRARLAPAFLAVFALAALASLWLVGNNSGIGFLQIAAFVAMPIVLIWGTLGSTVGSALAFPLGLLFFGLPIAEHVVPVLQSLTAFSAARLLSLSGIPVLLENHIISIPGSAWNVENACSGINYLTSATTVAYVYGGLRYRTWRNRLGFVVAAALIALSANIIRVYGTVSVAYLGADSIIEGTRHFLFGWLVFGSAIAVLMTTCGNWTEAAASPTESVSRRAPESSPSIWLRSVGFTSLAVVVLAAAPAVARWQSLGSSAAEATQATLPLVVSPWNGAGQDLGWSPRAVGAQSEFQRAYTSGNRIVIAYAGYYPTRNAQPLAAFQRDFIIPPQWNAGLPRTIGTMINGKPISVRETILSSRTAALRVWSWYSAGDVLTGSEMFARLLTAKGMLFHSGGSFAALAVATEEAPGIDSSAVLHDFLKHASFGVPPPGAIAATAAEH